MTGSDRGGKWLKTTPTDHLLTSVGPTCRDGLAQRSDPGPPGSISDAGGGCSLIGDSTGEGRAPRLGRPVSRPGSARTALKSLSSCQRSAGTLSLGPRGPLCFCPALCHREPCCPSLLRQSFVTRLWGWLPPCLSHLASQKPV